MTDISNDDGEITVGDSGPEVVVENIERKDFVKYAGASGDFNPIHYDEPFAKDAGYPSVFGQGMFTAGIASTMVTEWLGLSNITRFKVRFQSQVWPGDTIRTRGEVTEVETDDDGKRVHADLIVTNQDDEAVLSGEVVADID